MELVKEYKVTVRQFLTKSSDNPAYRDKKPVPMRTMFGYITQESANAVYVVLRGKAAPTGICMKCGRELSHPVSLQFGIGPECGGHFYASPMPKKDLEAWYESIKQILPGVTWQGWLPKGHIQMELTGEMIEPFKAEKAESTKQEPLKKKEAPMKAQRQPEVKVNSELVDALVSELGF